MSDTSQGPGWWLASDGKWYPPESKPGYAPPQQYSWPAPTVPGAPIVPSTPPATPGAGEQAQTSSPPQSGWGTYQQWGYPPPGSQPPGAPGYWQPPYGAPPPAYTPPGAYPYGGYPYARSKAQPLLDEQTGLLLAPWWKRLVAILIDFCVLGVAFEILVNVLSGVANVFVGWVFLGQVLVACIYYGALNGSRKGQTLGKMAMSIACRNAKTGQRIGFFRACGRYLIMIVFELALIIPSILDDLSPLWDKRRRAWHDHVAGTIVVETKP